MKLHTAHFAGWEHEKVQDEVIDKQGLPFSDELFKSGIPGIVEESAKDLFKPTAIPLDQISPRHARSYELGNNERQTGLWADQYGNRYTSLSYKGNNFSNPDITRSATAPSGFIPYGLQEDDAILRVIKASRILRENNISTEWIVGVVEPSKIPYGTELLTQSEYKQKLLEKNLAKQAIHEVGAIAQAIEPMTFFVTARCMEINDRPYDFTEDETKEAVLKRAARIFQVYNSTHTNDADFRELDCDNEADVAYYFIELQPKLQARNLAKLHNIGLVHKFPVPGNVTALGSVIDLDSVHGLLLGTGDADITNENIIQDLKMVYDVDHGSYLHILHHLENVGIDFSSLNAEIEYCLHRHYFIEEYIRTRAKEFSISETLHFYSAISEDDEAYRISDDKIEEKIATLFKSNPEVLDGFYNDIRPLLANERIKQFEQSDAYVEHVMDTHLTDHANNKLDLDESDDFTGDEWHIGLIRLGFASVIFNIEENVMKNVNNHLVTNRRIHPSLSTLYNYIGIEDSNSQIQQRLVLRSLLARKHMHTNNEQWSNLNETFRKIVSDSISLYFTKMDNFGSKNIGFGFDDDDGNDMTDPRPLGYFRASPYLSVGSIKLDDLLEENIEDDYTVKIHIVEKDIDQKTVEHILDLPIVQLISDGNKPDIKQSVNNNGVSSFEIIANSAHTYIARLTVKDSSGIQHLIIDKRPKS